MTILQKYEDNAKVTSAALGLLLAICQSKESVREMSVSHFVRALWVVMQRFLADAHIVGLCSSVMNALARGEMSSLQELMDCFDREVYCNALNQHAASEEAVHAFLAGRITFPVIAQTIEGALSAFPREDADSFEHLAAVDARTRAYAHKLIYGKSAS